MSGAFSRSFCRSDAGDDVRYELFRASQKAYNDSIEISKTAVKNRFDRAISQTQASSSTMKQELPFYVPSTKKELKAPKIHFKAVENIYQMPEIRVTDSPEQKFKKRWEAKIAEIPESKKAVVDDSLNMERTIASESSGDRTELKDVGSSSEEIFDFEDNKAEEEESQCDPQVKEEEHLMNDSTYLPKTLGGIRAFLSARCSESMTWKKAVIEIAGQMNLFSSSTSE